MPAAALAPSQARAARASSACSARQPRPVPSNMVGRRPSVPAAGNARWRTSVLGSLKQLWGEKPAAAEEEEEASGAQAAAVLEHDAAPPPRVATDADGGDEELALTDTFAQPLPGDSDDVAELRQLLAGTRLEAAPMVCTYDADRDGWSPDAFHARVDRRGPTLVVALTVEGALLGGYNPAGWTSEGREAIDSLGAFLFVWPTGDTTQRPIKLPKVGGGERAVVKDAAGAGIYFGGQVDGLAIPLAPPVERAAKSKLGAYYLRRPNGGRHLFTEGSPVKGGARGTELVSLRVYVAADAAA